MVNSYRYAFASSTPILPTTGYTTDLAVGQVGVFDGKTFEATNGQNVKSIILAQGVGADGLAFAGFTNKTLKSLEIKQGQIKSFKVKYGKKPVPMVWTLGYDGADTTKNLLVPQYKDTFDFALTFTGQPIAQLLGGVNGDSPELLVEPFSATLPCPTGCETDCGTFHDPNVVADAIIKVYNERRTIGGQLISEYVKADKIVTCETPSGLATTDFNRWQLTVVDGGGSLALAKVQAQYPGVHVTQLVSGLTSVYEIVLPDGVTPADFDSSVTPVIPNCSDCPDGYTLVPAVDTWVVSRPLSSSDDIHDATAQAAYAATINIDYSGVATALFLSSNGATANVQIFVTAGTSVTALFADNVILIGENQPLCTLDTPVEVAWTDVGDCTKALGQFKLTVKNNDCGGNYLTELQAAYGEVFILNTDSNTCTTEYGILINSDNYDCDDCGDPLFTWTTPAPFNGLNWVPDVTAVYGTGCNVGVRFTSVYEQRKVKECFFKKVAYEYQPLQFTVGATRIDLNDTKSLCSNLVPSTKVQGVGYPFGLGTMVANDVVASNYSYGRYWSCSPAERDAIDYYLNIDFGNYYDQYIIEFVNQPAEAFGASGTWTSHEQVFEHLVYYPQGTGTNFATVIQAFASKTGVTLEVV